MKHFARLELIQELLDLLGLPPDAKIVGINYQPRDNRYHLHLYSEEFSKECRAGDEVPEIELVAETSEFPDWRYR